MSYCIDSEYYERFGIGFQKFLTSLVYGKSLPSGRQDEGKERQE